VVGDRRDIGESELWRKAGELSMQFGRLGAHYYIAHGLEQ
jgi:hypothetical protein